MGSSGESLETLQGRFGSPLERPCCFFKEMF
jgi:hypothetical protein